MVWYSMLGQILAATDSATTSGTPVTGNIEITILLILGATLLLVSGIKLLFREA